MLIQNIETLRRFIPNALVTVQGETTLYDKMQVELTMTGTQVYLREDNCHVHHRGGDDISR